MLCKESRQPKWFSGQSLWLQSGNVLFPLRYELNLCYVEESRPSLWLHNGDVLCFLWGTNWIYICYVGGSRPPLWSSGQSSWLEIRRFWFNSRGYQIFWEVVILERGTLSLESTIEELPKRESSGSGLESREYGLRNPSRWPRGTLCGANLAVTSPTSDDRSVGILRSQTHSRKFFWLQG
jgi:hypothetical protein